MKNKAHPFRKKWGQNFLTDSNLLDRIVRTVKPQENDNFLEIGPGDGNLTEVILSQKPKKLYLIEKDDILSRELSNKYKKYDKIKIYNLDILDFNLSNFKDIIIISNLPGSTTLLFC